MIRKINLGNKKEAIKAFNAFKTNDYVPFDIELVNSHLKNINDSLNVNVFRKRSLFITSKTLWECMQPLGAKGKHNCWLRRSNHCDSRNRVPFNAKS